MLRAAIRTMKTVPKMNHVVRLAGPRADVGDRLVAAGEAVRAEQRPEHELGDPVAADADPERLAHRGGEAGHEPDRRMEGPGQEDVLAAGPRHDRREHPVQQVERQGQGRCDRDGDQQVALGEDRRERPVREHDVDDADVRDVQEQHPPGRSDADETRGLPAEQLHGRRGRGWRRDGLAHRRPPTGPADAGESDPGGRTQRTSPAVRTRWWRTLLRAPRADNGARHQIGPRALVACQRGRRPASPDGHHAFEQSASDARSDRRLRGVTKKKGQPIGQTIGGIIVGFDQQIFRTTPPVNELVAKGDAACAGRGGRRRDDDGRAARRSAIAPDAQRRAPRARGPGGRGRRRPRRRRPHRVVRVDGHELLRTDGDGRDPVGLVPDGAVRRPGPRRAGSRSTAGDVPAPARGCRRTRSTARSSTVVAASSTTATIATDLGPDWPFAGRAVQRFELAADDADVPARAPRRRADARLDRLAPVVPPPARRRSPVSSSSSSRPGRCTCATPPGIATEQRVAPPPGSVGRLLHRPAPTAGPALAGLPRADGRVRLPGLGRLHRPGGRRVRRAADRAARCAQRGPDGRAARAGRWSPR